MLYLLVNEILCALQIYNMHLFTWFNKSKWTLVVKIKPDRHTFLIPYFFSILLQVFLDLIPNSLLLSSYNIPLIPKCTIAVS